MKTIEVNGLTKDYGSGKGVFDVSFQVDEGEVFGFLGPNGAGKSTTIRHLMGFSKPDSGDTKILGKDSFGKYYDFLGHVGYIPGEIALPVGLTGDEFLKMMQDMQHIHNDAKKKEMLDLFKLDRQTLKGETKRMSLGVKRKLAVVAAFMSDPDVLILDEPTSGLDPVMQENFVSYVRQEKKRGKTVLLSSHIFSEVDATCDRIAIIKDGRIVSDFVADELRHASLKYYIVTFDSVDERGGFLSKYKDCGYIKMIREKGRGALISTDDADINKAVARAVRIRVSGFDNRKETLEDYFEILQRG